ncbi:glycoside hydrolase superfamily [Phascolomyces articulosus]|uniref:Glycoside hydrolase superfamily n=1 Tax=Phascolomyces articulosus TaxID=60185 RepID=A0AAD5KBZ8_9FUNG|nr:glycoside hydrolase superfamily [Phascolomyces articulosus]
MLKKLATIALSVASVVGFAQAQTVGVDVSALTSVSAFQCANGEGYTQAVVRCYIEAYGQNPGGALDSNCYQNYQNALDGGFDAVDIYMFPCSGRSTCKSPGTQVQEIIDYVGSNKMTFGTLWLDVEIDPSANNWPSASEAQATLQEYKSVLNASGWKWGVYSSQSQWSQIVGSADWELDSSVPVWYAHWDEALSFDNFATFGGWSKPTIKQYAGDVTFCSAGWDKNYYG